MIADRLIAHRGCALLRPENTVEALRTTAEIGQSWVEIDANLLGDGTPVLFHDDFLDRLTPAAGPLAACSWKDISELDVGSHFSAEYAGERIPRLGDAIGLIDQLGLGMNLEIKVYPHYQASDIVPVVGGILQDRWSNPDQLILSSFSTEALRLLRTREPNLQLGQLWEDIPEDWEALADDLSLVSIHCDYRSLQPEQITAIKSKGLDLYCYTVNDLETGLSLLASGVDGLITDNPLLYNLEN